MPSSYATLWTYPWDLHDEGPDSVLSRLKENIGLQAIRLAFAYHTFDGSNEPSSAS